MAVTAEPDTADTKHDESPVTGANAPSAIPKRAQIGIGAIAITGAVLSFSSLRELAITTGTSENIAWLFPITLDAAAGVAMFVWMRGTVRSVVSYARFLTWSFAVTSILCNSANHGFNALRDHPEWYLLWASIIVGAIPPIVFVTIVHVVFLARQPELWGGPEAVTVTAEPVATTPQVADAAQAAEPDAEPVVTPPAPEPVLEQPVPPTPVAPKPIRRRCDNHGCGKLLPPGSRVDRKFCDPTCRQAAARARNGSAVTA